MKVLAPTTDFSTGRSGKGTEELQGLWLWRPVGLDYRTSTSQGKQTLGGHKHNLVHTNTPEKGAVTSQETEPDFPVSVQQSLVEAWVDSGLLQGQGHWMQQWWHKSFWRTLVEHSPAHQQKIGLKIYWAWPCPSEEDPDSPTISPSHQEASVSLLSLPIRGQKEWKAQSQKTNQTDHLDHSLV